MVGVREVRPEDLKKKSSVEWYNNMLALRPNDTGLLYAKGSTLTKMGEHEEALKMFDMVISLDPNHIKSWDAKAKALFRMGKYVEALVCFNKLVELDPNDETYWYGKGETFSKLDRFRDALDCYNYAIELNPNYTDAWCGKGNALKELKSPKKPRKRRKTGKAKKELSEVAEKVESLDEALKCFIEVLNKNPKHAQALEGKGLILCEMGKVKEGLGDLDKAIEVEPERVETLYKKGKILNKIGKKKEAQHTFAKIMEAPFSYNVTHDPDCWVAKGLASYELEKFEDSLNYYEKALIINPEDSRAWYGKGDTLTKLGKCTEAIECYERAIKVKPKSEQAWYGKATALRSSGKTDEALQSYDKAIEINSKNVDAWHDKGTLLYLVEKFSEALECFVQVLDINPNHKMAMEKKEEMEDKIKEMKKEQKPREEEGHPPVDSKEALLIKAEKALQHERYEEALKLYDEILKLDRENCKAWDGKAKVLSKMGRYIEAMSCHETIVRLKHKTKSKVLTKSKKGRKKKTPEKKHSRVVDKISSLLKVDKKREMIEVETPSERADKILSQLEVGEERETIEVNEPEKEPEQKPVEDEHEQELKSAPKMEVVKNEGERRQKRKLKFKPENLDKMDRKIILTLLDRSKTVPNLSRGLGLPIVMGYSKVLRLEAMGMLECTGTALIPQTSKDLKVYRCSEKAHLLASKISIDNTKEEMVVANG